MIDRIHRVIVSQFQRYRRTQWYIVQSHPKLLHFVFMHCRRWYTKLRYRMTFGEEMSMCRPLTFHEKLFWLSVYYRHPLIMQCADKYCVRKYVRSCGCGDILNELYGVYDESSNIPWDTLPNSFVLKNNRGSGDNIFCIDKSLFDINSAIIKMKDWPKKIYGIETAEYQYAKIPYKLICEKYLLDGAHSEVVEYQLFCFNGQPESFLVRNDLETAGRNPYAVSSSLEWQRVYYRYEEEKYNVEVPKPYNYKKMIEYAKILASPFPHVRIDFYEVDNNLYFGEMTFSSHGNVLANYKPCVWQKWGDMLQLPPKYTKHDAY